MFSNSNTKTFSFILLVAILSFYPFVNGQNWLVDHILPDDYDNGIPPIEDDSVIVNATIDIWTFRIINGQQNFRADLRLCLEWYDPRIQTVNINSDSMPNGTAASMMGSDYTQVMLTKFDRFWVPDVYFRNSISSDVAHNLRSVNYLFVWPHQKLIRQCSQMRVVLICWLGLSNFPFDQNHCYFELENVHRLRLNMLTIHSPDGNSQVRVMHRFTGYCEPSGLNTFKDMNRQVAVLFNNQSCVYGALRFVRHVNYYVIRYYAPLFLCMCISCLGPWLPTNAWPARTILCATVLLTVIRISITGYNETPARDVVSLFWYFWSCQFFCYMCMCEYALALQWVQFVFEKKIAHKNNTESPDGYYFGKRGWYKKASEKMEKFLHFLFGPIDFFFDPQGRNKVDYVARLVIPMTMFLWVFVYLVATLSPWATKYRYY